MVGAKVTFCLCLAASGVIADDTKYMPGEAGRHQGWQFTATPLTLRLSRATAAEVKAADAAAQKLLRLILAVPVLNPPRGFEVLLNGTIQEPDPTQVRARTAAALPLDVWLPFRALAYYESGGKRMVKVETNHLDFFLNDLRPVILDHIGARKWTDAQGEFYLEPPVTAQVAGFPLYQDVMAITRPGESIWAPIPMERFLKALITDLKTAAGAAESERDRAKQNLGSFRSPAEQEKRRKEIETARQGSNSANEVRRLEFFFKQDEDEILRKANPDPAKDDWYYGAVGALKDAEGKLAALDAAGRQAPACVTGFETPLPWKMRLVPPGTPGCRTIVQANLGVFHPGLPRSAIQVITVEGIASCREVIRSEGTNWRNPGDCTANLEVTRQLDWKQVSALIER